MESFQAIRGFLAVVRRLLRRRTAARVALYAFAALLLILLLGPLLAGWSEAERAAGVQRGVIGATVLLVVLALVGGVLLPRLRYRDDPDVARFVGGTAPGVASDLLSTVELEVELARQPRFSRELAVALAASTAERVSGLDPGALVPAGRRRPLHALGAALLAYAAALGLAPRVVSTGWARMIDPPAPRFEETAVSGPLVGDLTLVLTYPAYTGRAPLTIPASSGDILAPRGTSIALETTALREASSAKIVFEQGPPLAVQVAGRTLRATFRVDKAAQFRFALSPAHGSALIEAEPHRIEVEPDRAPRVELFAPADELDVSSKRQVELGYNIDDDYGISEIALVWHTPGGSEHKVLPAPRAGDRSAQAKFLWDLAETSLPPGSRIAYHLEAKDNDDVGGPNVGASRTYYLRVFSPRERHEDVLEREQAIFEEAVVLLADHLEVAADDGERHRGLFAGLQKLVVDLDGLAKLLEKDSMAPKGLAAELEGMRGRLDKLSHEEQELLSGRAGGGLAAFDRRAVAELEKDVLALDDWIARQRLEELLAISDEIRQHKSRLSDLMEQYKRTGSKETMAEIEREIRAIEQRLAELEAARAKLAGEVADRYMNADAMAGQSAEDCFAKVRQLLAAGDVARAQVELERCSRLSEAQARALEDGLRGLRGERFSEEEKAMREMKGEISQLAKQQWDLAGQTDDLVERYKQRAAEAMRDRSNPQVEKAKKTLERLKKETAEIPRDGLTPFAQQEQDTVMKRLDDVGQMMKEGDVAEALAMARHAQDGLRQIEGDVNDDLHEGKPWSSKAADALEHVVKAEPLADQLVKELEQATPSPEEMMSPEDRQRLNEIQRRQGALEEKARKLAMKAQKRAGELPGKAGETGQQALEGAADQMGRAGQRMGALDPMGARDEARGAAEKLSEADKNMERAGRPTTVGQNGRDPDEGPVRIPGSEEYKPPEEFREDIVDAMKKEKPPSAYKDQVKRYYQELVK